MNKALHITNGDVSADLIRQADFGGQVIAWRDALYEGPVLGNLSLEELSKIRAKYLSENYGRIEQEIEEGFRPRNKTIKSFHSFEEVVLWFDQDLYSQLQLLQILAWFETQGLATTSLNLICVENHLERKTTTELGELFIGRVGMTPKQMELAAKVWRGVTSDNPRNLETLHRQENGIIPFLKATLKRFLEEFPAVDNGLSRTENQILEIIFSGVANPGVIFRESQKREAPDFMGDWSFWRVMNDLTREREPLIKIETGEKFLFPPFCPPDEKFKNQKFVITEPGKKVLGRELDRIKINGIDRYVGGTHLTKENIWRWNNKNQSLTSER